MARPDLVLIMTASIKGVLTSFLTVHRTMKLAPDPPFSSCSGTTNSHVDRGPSIAGTCRTFFTSRPAVS